MSSLTHRPATDADPDESVAVRVEQLYADHAGLVRSVCRSLLRDGVEAEDAVQQTFLSAQRALLNGSSPRDAAAWLVTIARHESFARVRTRMQEPLPIDTDPEATGPDAHAVAVHRQEVGDLRDALAELPAQQRAAILLRELRGLSYEEVAASLAVTTSAVESLLFRARRTLQTRLRSSLAMLPPGGFVRELATRLGGGFAAPAAAKVVAVGAGAALIAGGVVAGPRIAGLGHSPEAPRAAAPHTVRGDTPARLPFRVPARSGRDRFSSRAPAPAAPARHHTGDHSSEGETRSRPDGSTERESSTSRGGSDGSGDSSATSDSSNSGSNDGGQAGSGDTQTTSSGDDTTTTTPDSTQTTGSETTTQTTTTPGSDGSGG